MTQTPDFTPDSRALIRRLLDEPGLAAAVRSFPPRGLAKLIGHVGLEDAGSLIALASREQLQRVFDEDLWHNARPGLPEIFETRRFGLWLEVMLELGMDFTLQALDGMEEDFLVMAFSRLVWVLENQILTARIQENADGEGGLLEKALESNLGNEFARYWVLARDESAWNAVLEILAELDAKGHPLFDRLMQRCAALTWEAVEEQGSVSDLLSSSERLDGDVADARDQRREREGFVAPQEAASFLALARLAKPDEALRTPPDDPVLSTYLRKGLQDLPLEAEGPGAAPAPLLALLEESGAPPVMPKRRRLAGLSSPVPDALSHRGLQQALAGLAGDDPALHAQRMRELAYLANVLASGATLRNRALRPAQAAQAALAACGVGLSYLFSREPGLARPLAAHDCVQLFRTGWALLHQPDGVLNEAKLANLME